jgi:hypothetical protein
MASRLSKTCQVWACELRQGRQMAGGGLHAMPTRPFPPLRPSVSQTCHASSREAAGMLRLTPHAVKHCQHPPPFPPLSQRTMAHNPLHVPTHCSASTHPYSPCGRHLLSTQDTLSLPPLRPLFFITPPHSPCGRHLLSTQDTLLLILNTLTGATGACKGKRK